MHDDRALIYRLVAAVEGGFEDVALMERRYRRAVRLAAKLTKRP